MITFECNKLGRDKGIENLTRDGITPEYEMITGDALRMSLRKKMVEEAAEVYEAVDKQELIEELADVLEVIDGLCTAYDIDREVVLAEKKKKHAQRGGFTAGVFIKTLSMDPDHHRVPHFRLTPEKYREQK